MTIFIVDCSHHDEDRGVINWTRVRSAGIEVVIHKATEGDPSGYHFIDPKFQGAMSGAKAAGIPVIGGYHCLSHGDAASWDRQVDMFLQYLNQSLGLSGTGFTGWAMIDVEPFSELVSRGMAPTLVDVLGFQASWARKTGGRPLAVYLPQWYWEQLHSPSLTGVAGPLIASNYPISASQPFETLYAHDGGDSGRGWATYGGKAPAVWQFGSTNQIPGISGNCDCNAFKGSVEEFVTLVAPKPIVKPPAPPSKPPVWRRLLVNGASGADVRQWQQRMKDRGWKITVDDHYGPQSGSVCKQFQTEKRLRVTGNVDQATWNAAWTMPITK